MISSFGLLKDKNSENRHFVNSGAFRLASRPDSPHRLDATLVPVLVPVIQLSQEEIGDRILGIGRDPDNIDFDPANK